MKSLERRWRASVVTMRAIVIPKAPSGVQSMPTCCFALFPVENMPPPIVFVVMIPEPLPDIAILSLLRPFLLDSDTKCQIESY